MNAIHNLLKFFLVFLLFEKVGDIKEGVAFKSDINKCRLHSRQHPGHPPFIDGTGESVFVLPLEVDFSELLVF